MKDLVLDNVSENPFTSSVNAVVVRNKAVYIQHIVLTFDNSSQRRDDHAGAHKYNHLPKRS